MQNTTPPNNPPPTAPKPNPIQRTITSAHSEPVEIKNRIITTNGEAWYDQETPLSDRKAKQHCCTLL